MPFLAQEEINTEKGYMQGSIDLEIPELSFAVNEAINTLRGNIQLSGFNIKIVSVTSALKHEGKSSLSFLLARSFAALGKRTLFVDADIRNSHLAVRYGIARQVLGLTEYLCGTIGPESLICRTNQPNLDIIFTGSVAPNPSELFSGDLFRNTMASLRDIYDYIIVDTPPINAVIDGVLISKLCDGAVLVVESGVTERGQAQHAKQQLEYAGVKILGVALNKVGTKRSGYGYGSYGYGYGRYGRYGYGGKYGYGYGYGEDPKDKKQKR